MSSISFATMCKITTFPLFTQNQGRHRGHYVGNCHAYLVVKIYANIIIAS